MHNLIKPIFYGALFITFRSNMSNIPSLTPNITFSYKGFLNEFKIQIAEFKSKKKEKAKT